MTSCEQCRARSMKARQSAQRTVSSSDELDAPLRSASPTSTSSTSSTSTSTSSSSCDSPTQLLSLASPPHSPSMLRMMMMMMTNNHRQTVPRRRELDIVRSSASNASNSPSQAARRAQEIIQTSQTSGLVKVPSSSLELGAGRSGQQESLRPSEVSAASGRRHKRQTSYASMDWLLISIIITTMCQAATTITTVNVNNNNNNNYNNYRNSSNEPPSDTQPNSSLIINIGTLPRSSPNSTPGPARHFIGKRSAPTNLNGTNSGQSHEGAAPAARSARLIGSGGAQQVEALHYLQRYGYMNESLAGTGSDQLIAEESFQEAVTAFQRFAGIPETGGLDAQTVKFMQMPRCGNKDLGKSAESGRKRRRKKRRRRRKKRYALQGSKWRRQELTYRISQYPSRFGHKRHEVDSQIERAFRIWSQVAPIDFVAKKEGRVHVDIRFASGDHDDGDPFDGPGNTLAHAYFPQYGGDAHFDDQEYWTVDSYAGTNIFQVAAHELGHSLGLGHSSVREALMAPFYQKYKPNFRLHADDVLAIQALYGERDGLGGEPASSSSTTSTTTTTETPRRSTTSSDEGDDDDAGGGGGGGGFFGFGSGASKPVDLCRDAKIDAVTRVEDGSTYVFRGQYYWQIKNEGLAGGPAKISRDWDGLPGQLDAALTWSDGKTFFFKGDKYWRFLNKRREPGYPKPISLGFAGIPNNLDAAFVWSGNGKTYFFKRDKYWRFDSKQEPPVSSQYPKPLRNWLGLPGQSIDAAFKWDNGMSYFFKEGLYYRFDDRQFEVDSTAKPAFPRSTAEWWFGCPNSNSLAQRRASSADEAAPTSDSMMLFHRRPGQSYESAAGSLTSLGGPRPAGSSITRSILSGLSALFPGSSSAAADSADWAFHRGLGPEESRKLLRRNGQAAARANSEAASTQRWLFPLGSSSPAAAASRGEQSLSAELRLANSNWNENEN